METLRRKHPEDWKQRPPAKRLAALRLAALRKVAFELIPADPLAPRFRQGDTLGDSRKHWFRAKVLQHYRVFFRCQESERIIILAWVNDEATRRAYDSRTDAYKIFQAMLNKGTPPDDWDTLLKEAEAQEPLAGRQAEADTVPGRRTEGDPPKG